MISNIIYRLSCFADYSQLVYNKTDVIKVLEAFDDVNLAPNVIQEMRFDGMGLASQRMQFIASGGFTIISIHSDRIDVQFTSGDKAGFSAESIEELRDQACVYMEKVQRVFADRVSQANRLAWFTTYMYFEISEEEKHAFRDKFLKEVDFFNENQLDDLVVRYGARRDVVLNSKDERLNVLVTINRVSAGSESEQGIDGYQIEYDINTWQGNRRNRFEMEAVRDFAEKALEIQGKVNEVLLQ